ncbi:hypothetical protein B0I12_002571 [Microbacterium hydrothermale]|uniref:hypothetical protein n=1 Tax=Microbacterium hydrothermale TaxID=857427 RepID=UPI002225D1B7|nr:hypothetical protein [Microbacterium hydrothermale]MCW2165416.1 hypothetical protein [Microbacterium hydrothermale]
MNVTPEIWFKAQRVLRTIVQALVVLVPVVNGVAVAIAAYLTEQTDVAVPPVVFLWLNVAIAATALLMGLAARIMAVPGVNTLLTSIGLGSVPASKVTDGAVLPDPKVSTREAYQAALDTHNPANFRDPGAHNQP